MRSRVAVTVAALALSAGAAPASAGPAMTLAATGDDPHLVFDEQGVAHVAWLEPAGGGRNAAVVCRVSVASGCASPQRLPMPSDAAATQVGWTAALPVSVGPHAANVDVVLPEFVGSRVFLSQAPYGAALTGDPQLVHTDYRGTNARSATALGEGYAVASWNPNEDLVLFGTTPGTSRVRFAEIDGTLAGQSAVGKSDDAGLWLVHARSPADASTTSLVGQRNHQLPSDVAANWTPYDLGPGLEPAIAGGGAAGLYLANLGWSGSPTGQPDRVRVRRLGPQGATPAIDVPVPGALSGSTGGRVALAQARDTGELVVAFLVNATGREGGSIAVSRSVDNGTSWSAPAVVQQGLTGAGALDLAITGDGASGLVVWDTINGGAFAADLTPVAGPAVAPAPVCNVPNLQSTLYGRARQLIGAGGCAVGAARYVPVKTHRTDEVVAQSVARGTQVAPGTPVALALALNRWARSASTAGCLPMRRSLVLQRFAALAAAGIAKVTLTLNGRKFVVGRAQRSALRLKLSSIAKRYGIRPGGKLVRSKLVVTLSSGQRFGFAKRSWRTCGRGRPGRVPRLVAAPLPTP